MKRSIFILAIVFSASFVFSQNDKTRSIPSTDLKTLDGSTISSASFENEGKPMIISFWATWCKPCIKELNAIADEYIDWQDETGVKLIAISIDDARNTPKIRPFVNGKGWEYEVYLDPNSDFKRAMNVNTIPHTFLVNGDKQIVWQHNAYAPGDEIELYDEVLKLTE